jgi:hypothetical protein
LIHKIGRTVYKEINMRIPRQYIAISVLLSLTLSACVSNDISTPLDKACTDPRPQLCTRDYRPVCGVLNDGSQKTYGNGCGACSDESVKGFNNGACAKK